MEMEVKPLDCVSVSIVHCWMNEWTSTLVSVTFDQAVNESCYQGDDSVLKSLVEIADTAPKYLRPNLEATLQLCLKVSWNTLLQKYHFTALDTQNHMIFKIQL